MLCHQACPGSVLLHKRVPDRVGGADIVAVSWLQSGGFTRKSLSGDTVLGEPEPGSDAAALTKMRGHWLLPAVGKPAAAAVLADLKVQRIADGE